MRRLHLLPALAATLFCATLSAQSLRFSTDQPTAAATPSLTLEQAIALSIARNPGLSAARHELEASEGGLEQAAARPNPELSTLVEDTRHRSTRTTTALLAIPVELGGKRAARTAAAEGTRSLARSELRQVESELRSSVTAAFFDVLMAQERARLAGNSVDLAQRASAAVDKRVTAGKVSPVDATRATIDQANAELDAIEAAATLGNARQTLALTWREPTARFGEAVADLETVPTRPAVHDLIGELDLSPALNSSRAELDRRRALVELERSRRYPDLTVSLGIKRDNEIGRNQAVVGLSIPLPIFDRNQGAVREASSRLDKAADELDATRMRLLVDLHRASSDLETARATVHAMQATVLPSAQSAYEAAVQGFEAGKFGFLDVIDAQRVLIAARARYLGALAATYQAATHIDRLIGR
ncbi:TolC family protein [soil metagenome]